MTANGLLYVPPHSCACFIKAKLSGFYAFAPRRDHERVFTADELGYLERGRAYDQVDAIIARSKISAEDCPTYRCDVARSGWANCTVPIALKQIWRAPIGGRLTSPIAANGKVFIASVDTHTVYALDANSGEVIWTYTAGGRVDSPPTFYRGLLIFGCRDGYVYCLRASDGELVWRFRAAPQDRRIVAHGQLESVWPVHGSVLIVNDVLYFVAGRSSYLDNGIFLYRLDPKTGEKLSVTHIDSRDPVTEMEPRDVIRGTNMPGALPDILSSDGSSIFMRHSRFDLNGVPQKENVPHLFSPAGFLDDSWWHRTYWIIGTRMASGWGGWPIVGNTVHSGRLLVIDEFNVYGFGRESYATHGSHPGLGRTHYQLFAASRELLPPPKPKARKKRRARPPVISRVKYLWTKRIPVIVRAMVLADKTLFIAGPPNSDWEGMDALMAWEGKRNALLWVISASNGKKLAEYRLPSPPVFDGMIAAMGRLFICTQDGKVICLGGT
ncbi:MAG TPA: hypothetical protein EYP10_12230 [Armatimonadetes bacterium]|nr:hypothetical protein [Armatimonadota bacterium]